LATGAAGTGPVVTARRTGGRQLDALSHSRRRRGFALAHCPLALRRLPWDPFFVDVGKGRSSRAGLPSPAPELAGGCRAAGRVSLHDVTVQQAGASRRQARAGRARPRRFWHQADLAFDTGPLSLVTRCRRSSATSSLSNRRLAGRACRSPFARSGLACYRFKADGTRFDGREQRDLDLHCALRLSTIAAGRGTGADWRAFTARARGRSGRPAAVRSWSPRCPGRPRSSAGFGNAVRATSRPRAWHVARPPPIARPAAA
jgi:hypothetical protein